MSLNKFQSTNVYGNFQNLDYNGTNIYYLTHVNANGYFQRNCQVDGNVITNNIVSNNSNITIGNNTISGTITFNHPKILLYNSFVLSDISNYLFIINSNVSTLSGQINTINTTGLASLNTTVASHTTSINTINTTLANNSNIFYTNTLYVSNNLANPDIRMFYDSVGLQSILASQSQKFNFQRSDGGSFAIIGNSNNVFNAASTFNGNLSISGIIYNTTLNNSITSLNTSVATINTTLANNSNIFYTNQLYVGNNNSNPDIRFSYNSTINQSIFTSQCGTINFTLSNGFSFATVGYYNNFFNAATVINNSLLVATDLTVSGNIINTALTNSISSLNTLTALHTTSINTISGIVNKITQSVIFGYSIGAYGTLAFQILSSHEGLYIAQCAGSFILFYNTNITGSIVTQILNSQSVIGYSSVALNNTTHQITFTMQNVTGTLLVTKLS
jgi:hypothetical protein